MADTPQAPDPVLTEYLKGSQALTQNELAHQQQREQAMTPVLNAEQQALQQPMPQQPKPVVMPQVPKEPIVNGKDFQNFTMAMMGLALIGGGLSKSHWMRATASMNGAMKGYLQGSLEVAKKHKEEFDQSFKSAVEQEKQQNDEFLNAMSARDRSIKDILSSAEIISAKYQMVDAQDAIRRRDLDGAFRAINERQLALTRVQDMHMKMQNDFNQKQISRYDKLLQGGQISSEDHDKVVNAINAGEPIPQISTKGGMPKEKLAIPIENYLTTGQMPAIGMNNAIVRNQIIEGADELREQMGLTPAEIVASWSTRKADISALTQVTRQQVMVGGYEETAQKNLTKLEEISSKLSRTQYSQLFNQWLQYGRVKTGDVLADQFNAMLEETLSEYAKVMGGGYGAGASTEGAQARAHSLLSGATTPDQVKGVADTMRQTMKNRTESIEDQKKKLVNSIRHSVSGASSGGTVLKFDAQGNQLQ